ncbi:ADP-ribose pyrophosphatase, mitochondrial isoform X3 [Ictidomys tridecemlineatus]|uniref:ADP-ribose pyrophosphatase, mitochondrial isoform X3 n=1 Tax=Ictidomys tridecemlineatus TaxID=43179 RepID=UPI00068106D0|nr:ADP-ribose pyrophosphatase, mitochondrial isoform X3 [Ictidomys tridecemlineatus]XP_026235422.1 ADP-ribose pyrophosphatase, mitochondrial isoform X4 [Urocitellus parryii]KAG3276309.1 nudix hydrolase 9, transcript variant X2 [Ictidomys tridecemlineatus]
MAGRSLRKALATVSLSVALASVTVRSSGCRNIPAYRNSLLSSWFHLNSNIMSGSNGVKDNSHNKARTSPYPGSKVERSQVPNEKVGWLVEWQDYNPVEYTAVSVLAGPRWADPQISESNFSPKFNEKDGHVERKSQNGLYEIENGRPRNPAGRTGLVGRGLLGRWGPNHAADPIITRWKRDSSGNKITHPVSGKHILQFVAIKRKDCGEWAIPGIYKGYVDDPRNTDNAWMETEAVNYHDETGEIMDNLALEAGDDAGKVKWVDISDKLKLYASHSQFIKLVTEKRDAHWSEDSEADCNGS